MRGSGLRRLSALGVRCSRAAGPAAAAAVAAAAARGARQSSSTKTSTVAVFDRSLKRRQRNWSLQLPDSEYYDYLRAEAAERLCDRLEDINRTFPLALELGCHRGHVLKVLSGKEGLGGRGGVGGIETLVQCDFAEAAIDPSKNDPTAAAQLASPSPSSSSTLSSPPSPLHLPPLQQQQQRIKQFSIHCDEESLPFKEASFDAVLSSMSLHWVNDLPSTLQQIKRALRPDGVFLGSMLGGTTLQELRHCFYLAEQERRGGLSPHASPFALPSDAASLLQGAGFALPTVDVDTITIAYPDAFALMEHVQRMGEGTAALSRQYAVGSDTFLAMAALYQQLYGLEDGSVPATFQIIYMIGWAPHGSQPKPCKRGSATAKIGGDAAAKPPAVW